MKKNDWIWWVVIIALLVSITPLGLIGLFIYLNRNKNKTKQIPEKSGQTSYTAYTFNEAMDAASSAVNHRNALCQRSHQLYSGREAPGKACGLQDFLPDGKKASRNPRSPSPAPQPG